MAASASLDTYGKLRRIKVYREQHAATALAGRQAALEHRAAELNAKHQALAEFREQRLAREQSLFDEIEGRTVKPHEIETMNLRVAALREQEAAMETDRMEAERQVEQARLERDAARQTHTLALREVEKFDKLIEIAKRTAEREQLAREENEIEEIVTAAAARRPRH